MSNEIFGFDSTLALLAHLRKLDVRLTIEGEHLTCAAPKGVLTYQLQQEIKARKPEILEILRQPGTVEKPSQVEDFGRHCIHELFEAQAVRTAEAVAIVCGSERLTYRELSVRANRLANRLRSLGVGPNVLVGICLERSADMVIALLAVLKAGGAYVPLDPQFPPERLNLMLDDSGAAVFVTQQDLNAAAPPRRTTVLCLDRDKVSIEQESSSGPGEQSRPENLAYVIYTSGSTGIPKGVAVEHRSVVNLLESMRREPGISQVDRLLAVTTLSFDIAGLEIFLPLISGAQLIIAPRSAVVDGGALGRLLDESEATVMQATPVTWRLLLDSGWEGLPRLKMLCGGETLPRELANRLIATGGELWNLYGPTETTIWSSIYRVNEGMAAVPIGKPITHTQMYVLDEHRQQVPTGIVGELYIGGDGVAREYFGRPELTAERFVVDPFIPGNRLYRTGDLVRRLQDGNLEYLGRDDQQIKLRGFRIELGEIEAVLAQQPEVRQAVVELREDDPGDPRLTAYIIRARPCEARGIRQALAARLPDHMIPSVFLFLDAFPLTPNNKVDRKALRDSVRPARVESDAIVTSASDTTDKVAAIWRALLKVTEVGLHDDFFALGGHSLLIVQLQSLLRQQFSREVSIPDLFQRPTVAGLVELLDTRETAARVTRVADPTDGTRDLSGLSAGLLAAPPPLVAKADSNRRSGLEHVRNGQQHEVIGPGQLRADAPEGWMQTASCLVAAQPKGTRVPLFLVAGFQGPDDTLFVLSRIIPHLSPDQPVYGLKPRWTDGGKLYLDVEEEAAEYLAALRTVQPKGPYLLGGYCLSGLVALEMARQLLADGEQIGLLALIDTERPTTSRRMAANLWNAGVRALHIAAVIRDAFRFNDRARSAAARDLIWRQMRIRRTEAPSNENLYYRSKMSYQRIIREYVVNQYPGRITLIVNETFHSIDRHRGWRDIPVGELAVKKVPGDHITMFTEHGEVLAQLLLESVDSTLSQSGWCADGIEVGAS